jgi:hypothetical protein
MNFPRELLIDIAYAGSKDKFEYNGEPIIIIEGPKLVDHSRWNIIYEVVFKYFDKYYQTHFSRGATEMQDEEPYEHDDDEVFCPEVIPTQVVHTVYTKVETTKVKAAKAAS